MNAVLKAFVLLVALMAICVVAAFMWISSRGISARRTRTCRNGCGADHAAAGHSSRGPQSPEPRHGDA